ncbi:MAG: hypothetical protein FWF24_03430 [Alphaproteobacteria bacterium]|nr:hypothetical protein [Alphaproteobacteria bacterium]
MPPYDPQLRHVATIIDGGGVLERGYPLGEIWRGSNDLFVHIPLERFRYVFSKATHLSKASSIYKSLKDNAGKITDPFSEYDIFIKRLKRDGFLKEDEPLTEDHHLIKLLKKEERVLDFTISSEKYEGEPLQGKELEDFRTAFWRGAKLRNLQRTRQGWDCYRHDL